jgi:hypothetical protein
MANNKVTIKLDSNNNLIVGEGLKNGQDEVVWHNQTGEPNLYIDFAGNSPFDKDKFGPIGAQPEHSGLAKRAGTFKYTVKLAGHKDLDPNVIVDN